jgi:hypothetical protein
MIYTVEGRVGGWAVIRTDLAGGVQTVATYRHREYAEDVTRTLNGWTSKEVSA